MRARVVALVVMTMAVVPTGLWAEEPAAPGLPAGLVDFIEARIYESKDMYRDAVDAYQRALDQAPERTEVRIRYASLLLDLGLGSRSLAVLDGVDGLDWFGLRIRALALAQHSTREPERLPEAEAALRTALEIRNDDPNLRLALAQVLDRTGEPAQAEEVVAQLRATHGGSAQLVAYHARLLRTLGRDDEALLAARQCAGPERPFPSCRDLVLEILAEQGRDGEAGELLLEWSEPDDLDALLRAAAMLARSGRFTGALGAVRRVLAVEPDSPRARNLEAMVLAATGRHEQAVAAYRDLLRRDRDDVDLLMALAWSAAAVDDLEAARDAMDRAWEVVAENAGSPAAARVAVAAARTELVSGQPLRAREWLGRVGDVQAVADEYIGILAETYRRQEAYEEGVAAMLRLAPQVVGEARVRAQAVEAELRARDGDPRGFDRLEPLLESADVTPVIIGLQVLQVLEEWARLEPAAAAAADRFPDNRELRFTHAVALERLDRMDEAAEILLELLDEEPGDAAAANYLGYSWADRGLELERALELIERAVAAEPENAAYLDSLGWVNFRLGRLDEAESWLRRAAELDESNGTILAHLGEVLLARDRREARTEAGALLTQALAVGCEDPDHVRRLLEGLRGDD